VKFYPCTRKQPKRKTANQECPAKSRCSNTNIKPDFCSFNLPTNIRQNKAMKQAKLFGEIEIEPKVLASLELSKAKMLASQISDQIKPLCIRLELVGFNKKTETCSW
jgi:hypothetical protein